jgi:hypothetical protein
MNLICGSHHRRNELAITELEFGFGTLVLGASNLVEGRTLPGRTVNVQLGYKLQGGYEAMADDCGGRPI